MDNDEIKYINLIDHTALGEDDPSPYTLQIPEHMIQNHEWTDWNFDMSQQTKIEGTVSITGDDADIEIAGVSITQTLSGIQERLAILQPNPELEKEFLELAKIREQYIKLEKTLLEKKAVWDALGRDD
jgi:hypothetical protein